MNQDVRPTKTCIKCGETKDLNEFYVKRESIDGHQGYCKTCHKKLNQAARKARHMNQQKFEQTYRGLSAQAKKVYDAIPIKSAWSLAQIMAELHRLNLSLNDQRVVLGCLNSLKLCGLVVEVGKLTFRRETIRHHGEVKAPVASVQEEIVKQEQEVNSIPTKTECQPATKQSGAMDMLGQFAIRLRALADDAETIAMEIASQAEKNEIETTKMRQLQALLKSLG